MYSSPEQSFPSTTVTSILTQIPDARLQGMEASVKWIDSCIAAVRGVCFSPCLLKTFRPIELPVTLDHPFGPEAFRRWRQFALAILAADWCCYDNPADRIDYARLKYIMSSCYRNFRLWCCRTPQGQYLPCGYTAWYPISGALYYAQAAQYRCGSDRELFVPLRHVTDEQIRYVYALNASIIAPLRNTPCSQRLIRAFMRDARKWSAASVLAATVDEAGAKFSRVARRHHQGEILIF